MSLPEPNSAEVNAEAASDTSGNEPEPLVLTVTVPSWAAGKRHPGKRVARRLPNAGEHRRLSKIAVDIGAQMPRIALALDGGCNPRAHFRCRSFPRLSLEVELGTSGKRGGDRLGGLRGVLLGNAQRSIIGVGHHLTAALQQKRSKLVAQRRAIHFPTVMARLHVSNAARNGYVVVGMRLSDGRIYFGCERIDKLIVERRRYGNVRPEKLRAKTRQRAAGVATDGKGGIGKALGIDGDAKACPIGNLHACFEAFASSTAICSARAASC